VHAKVRITGLAPGAGHRIVLAGSQGQGCASHEIRSDEPKLIHLTGPCWQCPGAADSRIRVAVFARGHAVAYLTTKDICKRGPGAEVRLEMKPRVPVKVAVWAVRGFGTQARDEVVNADWTLDQGRAGVTLDADVESIAPDRFPPFDINEDEEVTCAKAAASQLFRKGAVNVYFGIGPNFTCASGEAIFIFKGQKLGILAHEMGHALGLLHGSDGERVYDQGHTNDRASFDCANAMWRDSDVVEDALSLGQAFWIGVSSEPFAAKGRGDPRKCRSDPGSCIPWAIPRRAIAGQPRCQPCTFREAVQLNEEVTRQLEAVAPKRLLNVPRHCTEGERGEAVGRRFDAISAHALANPRLPRLGTPDRPEFVERWQKRLEVAVLFEAIGNLAPADRQAGIDTLEDLKAKGWEANDYADEAIRRLKAGQPLRGSCSSTK
jgi:hypothetical protein